MRHGWVALGLLLFSTSASALTWQSASDLPGVHPATPKERSEIAKALASTAAGPVFGDESARILVHEGNLHVAAHLQNGELLVVRGNLMVDGMYDDYRDGIGSVAVFGDFRAANVYSWGSIHVAGNMHVSGLLMTVYNDFTFDVEGKVDARALVVSDKSHDYKKGAIGVEWTDDRAESDIGNALRRFVPEVFTRPGHLELDEDGGLDSLDFDAETARQRLHEGHAVFLTQTAPESLIADARRHGS